MGRKRGIRGQLVPTGTVWTDCSVSIYVTFLMLTLGLRLDKDVTICLEKLGMWESSVFTVFETF